MTRFPIGRRVRLSLSLAFMLMVSWLARGILAPRMVWENKPDCLGQTTLFRKRILSIVLLPGTLSGQGAMTSSLKLEDLELNNAARVFRHKVKLHRVDNGLDGVKSLVQQSSSSLVETNRRHGKMLKDMTAQFEHFENKYRNYKI